MLAHLATILRPYKTQAALMAAGDTRLDTTYNTHAYQHHALWGATPSAKKMNQLLCTGAMEGVREGVCVIICNLARLDSLMCGYTEKLFCWLPVLLSSAYDVKSPPGQHDAATSEPFVLAWVAIVKVCFLSFCSLLCAISA